MVKLYTKTGDKGNTRLWDGSPISKLDPRIEAIGTLDELDSAIGLARGLAPASMSEELNRLQEDLMYLMAYVARGTKHQNPPDPSVFEKWMDQLSVDYPTENHFVHPGDSPAGGALHLARSIARRAERRVLVLFNEGSDIEPAAYQYINRLSDLLFALAHKADVETKVARITDEVVKRTAGIETELNLEECRLLMDIAQKKAKSIGRPMVIAVCDAAGDLYAFERMDGALLVSIAHAQNKARSAVRIQMDTKDIASLAQPGASYYGVQNEESFSIIGGGRLLKKNGRVVGAIGVSGGSVDEDLAVANAVVDYFESRTH